MHLGDGGGGDGGGKGGGNGKGGNGKAGANGSDGDQDAQGGGKGAGDCGQGGRGGCTNCSAGASAGDPVDVLTGDVFTLPAADLYLPGFFCLRLLRQYHVRNRTRDVGLGFGWSHSLAWKLELRRRAILVTPPFDKAVAFEPAEVETGALGDGGWILKRDIKSGGFRLDANTDFRQYFEPSDASGESFRLTRIEDPNHNRLELRYDEQGRLASIVDTVGREILVQSDRSGRIAMLSVRDPHTGRTVVFSRYFYDDRGRLVRHLDVEGSASHYEYDDANRLTSYTYPSGLRFTFVYNSQGRCVQTWGEYPGGMDPALASDVPQYLADGVTRARGIYHVKLDFSGDGFTEVVDSVRCLRFIADPDTGKIAKGVAADGGVTTRTFDAAGNVSSRTDPENGTTFYDWDDRGRLTREIDALGRAVSVQRDTAGRVVTNTDKLGGVISCHRDMHGNVESIIDQQGAVTMYRYDDHGLVTERIDALGGRTEYQSDAHGNLALMRTPSGATWAWEWDYFGRLVKRVDPHGRVERMTSSDGGLVLSVSDDFRGRTVRFEYDAMGQCVAEVSPEGVTRFEYGGLRWLSAIHLTTGDVLRFEWNREGWMVRAANEKGELLEFEFGQAGDVLEERLFGNVSTRVRYDQRGRPISWTNGRGEKVTFARDLMGRISEVEWADGSKEVIEYNARDEETSASGWWGVNSVQRNAVGDVVREEHVVGDRLFWIDLQRDHSGRVVGRKTSLGYSERIDRDASGSATRIASNDQPPVLIRRTVSGVVTERLLPRGGTLKYEIDSACRRTAMRVLTSKLQSEGPDQSPPRPVLEKWYSYSSRDDVLTITDRERGAIFFEYDARQRVVRSHDEAGEDIERFGWDATSNLQEMGVQVPVRNYDAANRLLRRGDVSYAWDAAGFLRKKSRTLPNGSEETWTYEWNPQGQLVAVETPERRRIEMLYDRYGRRLRKRLLRPDPASVNPVEESVVHFVWSADKLIHELREDGGTPRLRTFIYDDFNTAPWAHEDAIIEGEEVTSLGWVYYANDVNGFPTALVSASGEVLAELEHSVYGVVKPRGVPRTSTSARFTGQHADEETGLYYNRYRFYDPEVGRYISPDPLGPDAGFNVYQYCPNPVGFSDPLGLDAHGCTTSITLHDEQGGGTFVPTPEPGVRDSERRRGAGTNVGSETDQLPGFRSTMGHTVPGAARVDRPMTDSERQASRTDGTANTNRNQTTAHTEQNAIEWAETRFAGKLQGSQMNMGGDYPPCPRCHRAMQEFAARNGAQVQYNWPVNNRMTYDGTRTSSDTPTRRAVATGEGKWGTELAMRYNEHEAAMRDFGHHQRSMEGDGAFNTDAQVRGSYDEIYERQRREGSLGGGSAPAGAMSPIPGETSHPDEFNRPLPQMGREQHTLDDDHRNVPPVPGQRTGQGGGVGRYGDDGMTVELTRMMGA